MLNSYCLNLNISLTKIELKLKKQTQAQLKYWKWFVQADPNIKLDQIIAQVAPLVILSNIFILISWNIKEKYKNNSII